jgi:hypothetical protein
LSEAEARDGAEGTFNPRLFPLLWAFYEGKVKLDEGAQRETSNPEPKLEELKPPCGSHFRALSTMTAVQFIASSRINNRSSAAALNNKESEIRPETKGGARPGRIMSTMLDFSF